MEVGTLVRVPDAPQAAPDQAGGYQIPLSIRGGTYWALVDVVKYPVVLLTIQFRGQKHKVEVAVNPAPASANFGNQLASV